MDVSYTIREGKFFKSRFKSLSNVLKEDQWKDQVSDQYKDDVYNLINLIIEEEEIREDLLEVVSDLPGPSIGDLQLFECDEDVIDTIVKMSCSWSIIYFDCKRKKLYVGRDVFGRLSILFSCSSNSLTLSYTGRPSNTTWYDLPYGQVSVINIDSMLSSLHYYSFIHPYPDNIDHPWSSLFSQSHLHHLINKDSLITISRELKSVHPTVSHMLNTRLRACIRQLLPIDSTSVGICFSGGVDSLLIARLTMDVLPSNSNIDLINVAFGENDKSLSRAADRSRAIEGLEYLRHHCPTQNIRLVLVNVPPSTLRSARSLFIPFIVHPSTTVLDESIASVLFFALRGKGIDYDTGEDIEVSSKIRLMGSGADELFAGYARHRNRFERDGNSYGIVEECEAELRRLGVRNGGRDARVGLLCGVHIKSPFLYDDLVQWANSLPIEDKVDLSKPRGIGEKKIIREALSILSAPNSAPKQAMQFGSGIVKMENDKSQKGSHHSQHLVGCQHIQSL